MKRLRFLALLSFIALPLPVGAQTAQPLGHANRPAPDEPVAMAFAWYDGLIQYSTITNCASIIQGFPYQEYGAGTYVGFFANPEAAPAQPAPNTTYYVHVVIAGLGNSCSGMRAYLDLALPASTSLAITASNRVYCFVNGTPITGPDCPQSLPPSSYNPGAYAIPSADGAHAYTWPVPQGYTLEFQIPVMSSVPLSNSPLQANVWMLDGNSSPWLRPQQGVYVFSNQPTILYPSPSTRNVTATTALSEAYLYTQGATGTGYFDLGTTTGYGLSHNSLAIPSGTAFLVWDDWLPLVLTPDTLYHWRFTFTPSSGSPIFGADQTFRTLPDGRVTVGNGQPASCTPSAFGNAITTSTTKEILFDCGALPVTIAQSSAYSIGSNLTINGGNKVTLQRQDDDLGNHFNVQAGAHLALKQITLSGGVNTTDCGGSINVLANAQLTVNETRFVNNRADNQGGAVCNSGSTNISSTLFTSNTSSYSHGGAIGNYGSMSITNSKFTSNSAAINGGGIDMVGSTTVTNSTFSGNTAGFRGGGINSYFGTLTLVGSSFAGNTAQLYGGGLASDASTTTIAESTFSGNSSANVGGGLESSGAGALTITNSTVTDNSAVTDGGGLYWSPGVGTGPTTILNSTIANNTAGTQGGNIHTGSVGVNNADINLRNTIVASGSPNNCSGTLLSLGNNLETTNTCGFTATGDKINTNPNLGPLQNNGGPTLTRAISLGSPAIDAVTSSDCPDTDQRGTARPRDGDANGTLVCDIGAFESLYPSPVITKIDPNGGPAAGGQSVTITGTNLSGATVTIGGNAAAVTATTATTATFTTPAHAVGAVDVTVTATFGSNTAVGGYTYFPLSTPTFSATATSTSQVALSWSVVSGATSYEVWRSSQNGSYTLALSTSGTSANDTGLSPDTTYLYKVRAIGAAGSAGFTAIDPATTVVFSDPSLSGVPIRAVHIAQLRTAVNAMRTAAGLSAAAFIFDPTLTAGSTTIKRVHITQLRGALDAARLAIGLAAIGYTDPTITAGSTVMKVAHITELRAGTQ